MARGSLHLSMFVQGDHLYDERDVTWATSESSSPTITEWSPMS